MTFVSHRDRPQPDVTANRSQALGQLFIEADIIADIRGTRWAGYQAIAEYLDHAAPVHGKTVADTCPSRSG